MRGWAASGGGPRRLGRTRPPSLAPLHSGPHLAPFLGSLVSPTQTLSPYRPHEGPCNPSAAAQALKWLLQKLLLYPWSFRYGTFNGPFVPQESSPSSMSRPSKVKLHTTDQRGPLLSGASPVCLGPRVHLNPRCIGRTLPP